jgi:hypothetical protein
MGRFWLGLGTKVGEWLMKAGLSLMEGSGFVQKAAETPKQSTPTRLYEITDDEIYVILELNETEVSLRGFIGTKDQAAWYRSSLKGMVVLLQTFTEFREELIANALQPHRAKVGWDGLVH